MSLESVTVPPDHGKGTSAKSKRERNLRARLLKEQRWMCFWCGNPMQTNHYRVTEYGRTKLNPAFASFEHLIPKSHGGMKGPANIVLAHVACNNNRAKRKWPHDPVFGPGAKPLNLVPQTKHPEPRNRIKALPIAETRRVLRGGYWIEK